MEENNNELSDILLEQKDPNRIVKIKRIIVIAVLLVLLFILVLMIMKFINKPDDSANVLTDSLLQQTPPITVVDEPLVIANTTEEEQNTSEVTQDISVITELPPIIEESENITKIQVIDHTVTEPKVTPPAKTAPVTTPKTTPAKIVPQTVKTTNESSEIDKNLHYIQVSSITSDTPDKGFLNALTSKGYKYYLAKSPQRTRIVVGPYLSAKEAREDLPRVQKDISKDAFYYKH